MPAQNFLLPTIKLPPGFQVKKPKKPVLAILGRKIGEGLDYMDSYYAPHLTTSVKQKVRECLGQAMASLFSGEIHAARNALLVAADTLAQVGKSPLPFALSPHIKTGRTPMRLPLDFFDTVLNADLWEMVSVNIPDMHGGNITMHGSTAVRAFSQSGVIKDLRISVALQKIAEIADALTVANLIKEDLKKDETMFNALAKRYDQLPGSFKSKKAPSSFASSFGFTSTQVVTYQQCWDKEVTDYIYKTTVAVQPIITTNDYDSADLVLFSIDSVLNKLFQIINTIVANIEAARLAAAAAAAEEAARIAQENQIVTDARAKIENNDLWDLILDCTTGSINEHINEALDAWWGAKKWIILAGCALINMIMVISSGFAALPAALAGFIACFIKGMLSEIFNWDLVIDIACCIVGI